MNFKQVVKAMKEGKKVYRKEWNLKQYLFMKYKDFVMKRPDEKEFSYKLTISDIEATDWEIYKEEDNWSLCSIHEDNWIMPMYHSMLNQIIIMGNPTENRKKYYSRNKLVGYDKVAKMINLILEDIGNVTFARGIDEKCKIHNAVNKERQRIKEIIKKRFGK